MPNRSARDPLVYASPIDALGGLGHGALAPPPHDHDPAITPMRPRRRCPRRGSRRVQEDPDLGDADAL